MRILILSLTFTRHLLMTTLIHSEGFAKVCSTVQLWPGFGTWLIVTWSVWKFKWPELLKFIERLSEAIKIFALIWSLALGSIGSQILSILNILTHSGPLLWPFTTTVTASLELFRKYSNFSTKESFYFILKKNFWSFLGVFVSILALFLWRNSSQVYANNWHGIFYGQVWSWVKVT